MTYRVRLDPDYALPMIRQAAPTTRRRLREAIDRLATDPLRPRGIDTRRLDRDPTQKILHRARIGDWRIIYHIATSEIFVVRVIHRSEGYGWLADLD